MASQMISSGGTERQLSELSKAIDHSRFEPHVFCFIGDEARAFELAAHGVKVVVLPVRSFARFSTIRHAFTFASYLRRHKIRIFHAFDMPFAIFGAPLARIAGVPVVLTSVRGNRDLYSPLHRKLLRVSDRFVDGIVANAVSLVDHLRRQGVSRNLLRICHNGIDLRRFPVVDRDAGRPLTIGCVCVLRREKNLETLLRAYAALSDRENLRLRITGGGQLLESLRSLAATLSLDSAEASFHPATDDVATALQELDIFVLPSFSEGLSNSLMEAMVSGCAVAASAVGGNLELIRDGETGLLFDPLQVESLTAALRRLVGDGALRRRLAAAGSTFIRERFSMSASARSMEGVYEEFLAASRTIRTK